MRRPGSRGDGHPKEAPSPAGNGGRTGKVPVSAATVPKSYGGRQRPGNGGEYG